MLRLQLRAASKGSLIIKLNIMSNSVVGKYCFRFQSIDIDAEQINLEKSCDVDVTQLPDEVPTDKPRYHFFLFKHTHEGDYLESIGK